LDYYGYYFGGGPVRSYDLHPDGRRFIAYGVIHGGRPILRSEIPEQFRQAVDFPLFSPPGFETWLRSDPRRVLSPELERNVRANLLKQINLVQNWLEELKAKVPVGK
jgi:hypothetical protein